MMEYRQLVALILALIVVAGLAATYLHLSRERRAHKRAHRRAEERRRLKARSS